MALVPYGLGMTGKRDKTGPGGLDPALFIQDILNATEGVDLADLTARSRAVEGVAKATVALVAAGQAQAESNAHVEAIDAATEDELRAELLRRLDGLAAEIEARVAGEASGSGPGEDEPRGLEWLVARRAEADAG